MNEHKNLARTLDNTSWSIADIIGPIGIGVHNFSINFTSSDTEYASIRFVGDADSGSMYYDDTAVATYPLTTWVDAAYQTVTIAGGIDATNPTLLAWFQQYAKNMTLSGGDTDIVGALNDIVAAISDSGGLPDPSEASAGDVLFLNKAKKPAWAAPSEELPDSSEASAGDVLTLDEDKKPTWAAPSGGGMPEDYPYIADILFEGNATYDEYNTAHLDVSFIPDDTLLVVTINGIQTDLYYGPGFWSNTHPYDSSNSTIEFGNGTPAWLYTANMPAGTCPVKIESKSSKHLDENFEGAVEEIVDANKELPAIASGDAGKVLKVNSGESGVEWGDVPTELPSVTGNAGKVLKVNSGATGVEWGNAGGGNTLYSHLISLNVRPFTETNTIFAFWVNIISSDSTPFTYSTLYSYLVDKGYSASYGTIEKALGAYGNRLVYSKTSPNYLLYAQAYGIAVDTTTSHMLVGLNTFEIINSNSQLTIETGGTGAESLTSSNFISDTVTQL